MLYFLIFNDSPFGFHLWYLGALLYVLFIVYLARKFRFMNLLYKATPFLLFADLMLGKYSLLFFGKEFPVEIVRNFMFVGIPYFCIGMFIWKSMQYIRTISLVVPAILSILFCILTVVERWLLVNANINAIRDQYICTTLLSVTIFWLFAESGKKRNITAGENLVAMIGKKYSTGIYIVHPIIITIVTKIMTLLGIYSVYRSIAACIIFIVSIIIVALFQICHKVVQSIIPDFSLL